MQEALSNAGMRLPATVTHPALPATQAPSRHFLWSDLLVALLGLAMLLAWDGSGLDLALVRHWGDAQGFAWREHWLTAKVLHEGGRAAAWLLALVLIVNCFKPLWPRQTRTERLGWLAMTVFCVVLIPLLKHQSQTSCPWDLAEFGGVAHYVSHWHIGVADGGPGRCFPSGHASSAFAFLSGFFALRRAYPRSARAWLLGVLLVGTLFGWTQMARGAHYASHTMWTAWICWCCCAVGALALRRRP
ncbi:phosphatase PAP2 family protein [Roseateles violae]|uniref:Phosphatase PAP2 family protein n=1 Tax=Roseateles violae TaxID=3058042 RepID=A0ABT8DL02_9BURK|nr:phosphatase PAP2 family protein [Pelomonas sp. PFR6]MDN3919090.1 phosphatase PAP2 family protein [Pelomonas sp. PFR6]